MELFFSNGALAVLEKQFPEKIMLSRECREFSACMCLCVYERGRDYWSVCACVRARARAQ